MLPGLELPTLSEPWKSLKCSHNLHQLYLSFFIILCCILLTANLARTTSIQECDWLFKAHYLMVQ